MIIDSNFVNLYFAQTREKRQAIMNSLSPEHRRSLKISAEGMRGSRDPAWWLERAFDDVLWDKQIEIVESVRDHPRTMVKSCHGAGKSYTAARLAIWFLETHPYSIVVTTAPTFRQVKTILWNEIRLAYRRIKIECHMDVSNNLNQTEAKVDDMWRAFGFSTNDPDAFQGLHTPSILVIFDEASGIPPEIWTSAQGVLTSEDAHLLGIGNPTNPSSIFADEFTGKRPANSIRISAYDTPNFTTFGITEQDIIDCEGDYEVIKKAKIHGPLPYPALVVPEWVVDAYYRWGPNSPMYVARVLGEFPSQAEDTLIPNHLIDAACNRTIEKGGEVEAGIDVAYMGQDYNVFVTNQSGRVRVRDTWNGLDTVESYKRNVANIDRFGVARAKIDVIGYGAGVADQLSHHYGSERVWKVNVAEASTKPMSALGDPKFHEKQFSNLRAELYWGLREDFEAGLIDLDPHDDDLRRELRQLIYKIDPSGRIKIESKDDMRVRLGRSPDRAEGVMLSRAQQRSKPIPIIVLSESMRTPSIWTPDV